MAFDDKKSDKSKKNGNKKSDKTKPADKAKDGKALPGDKNAPGKKGKGPKKPKEYKKFGIIASLCNGGRPLNAPKLERPETKTCK